MTNYNSHITGHLNTGTYEYERAILDADARLHLTGDITGARIGKKGGTHESSSEVDGRILENDGNDSKGVGECGGGRPGTD